MAYATTDQLAAALRLTLTTAGEAELDSCLEAAAAEIDQVLDRTDPLPDPPPALVVQVNIERAVEWFKASDAAFGGVGSPDIGVLAMPDTSWARHVEALNVYKQGWGVA